VKPGLTPSRLRRLSSRWPPCPFAGIGVARIGGDRRGARMRLRLRWFASEITAPTAA
jgi:hypothetical protein